MLDWKENCVANNKNIVDNTPGMLSGSNNDDDDDDIFCLCYYGSRKQASQPSQLLLDITPTSINLTGGVCFADLCPGLAWCGLAWLVDKVSGSSDIEVQICACFVVVAWQLYSQGDRH